jgi:hypothetical protein
MDQKNKKSTQRRYPPFWERAILGIVIVGIVIVAISVALGIFPGSV